MANITVFSGNEDHPVKIENKPKKKGNMIDFSVDINKSKDFSKSVPVNLGDKIVGKYGNKSVIAPKDGDTIDRDLTLSRVDFNIYMVDQEDIKYGYSKLVLSTRDLSWLEFNERILDMAANKDVPLLERLNFLGISSSNLDEFLMVRVPKLLAKIEKNPEALNMMDEPCAKEYSCLMKSIDLFQSSQSVTYNNLMKELEEQKIYFIKSKKDNRLTDTGKKFLKNYFKDKIQSLLTPLVFDNTRPFPLIRNNNIYIGTIIKVNNSKIFGTIQVPSELPRVIEIVDASTEDKQLILVEDLIITYIDKLYIDRDIDKTCTYRILRNYNYHISETKVFVADEISDKLKRRQSNDIVRLDITDSKKNFIKILDKALHHKKKFVNKSDQLDLSFCSKLRNIKLSDDQKDKLLYSEYKPNNIISKDYIFDNIDDNDVLLHHPYDSYESVINFIDAASTDSKVVAIKITLYRVSSNSPIVKSLIKAAKNGKHVTVLLEVQARFDEMNNLRWATELEENGSHVIYGVPGLKTHCKMFLVIRKNNKGNLNKYAHICTGNYNENNGKLYTDISLLTTKDSICDDVEVLFNYLTGYGTPKLNKLSVSPFSLGKDLIANIDKCIGSAKLVNKKAAIFIKVNALTDRKIIDKLCEAADNGVKITLVVRSSCALLHYKNIRVISVIGRYLEHSRIFSFNTDDNMNIFISSSDLMERNLYNRIELMVPILDKNTKGKMTDIINNYLKDDSCYEIKNCEEGYNKLEVKISSQEEYMNSNNTIDNLDN